MGISDTTPMVRSTGLAAIFLMLVVAVNASESTVYQMEETLVGETMTSQTLQDSTQTLLNHADMLLSQHAKLVAKMRDAPPAAEGAEGPSKHVLGLTEKIAAIQNDIQSIRQQRTALTDEATQARANAGKASTPDEKDNHLKAHITAGAKAQDLSVMEDTKAKELTELTIGQHGAAGGASDDPWSTEAFENEWTDMRASLKEMLAQLHAHVDQIKAAAQTHYEKLQANMAKVKEHYKQQAAKRLAAETALAEAKQKAEVTDNKERAAKDAEREAKAEYKKYQETVDERMQKAVAAEKAKGSANEGALKASEAREKAMAAAMAKLKGQASNAAHLKASEEAAKAEIRRLKEAGEAAQKKSESDANEKKTKSEEGLNKAQEAATREQARAEALSTQLAKAKETEEKAVAKETSRADSAEQKLAAAESEVSKHQSLLAAAKEALLKVKSKIAELKTAFEEKISTQKAKTAEQKQAKEDAQAQAASTQKINEKLQQEVAVLNAKIAEETKKTTAAESKAAKLSTELDVANKEVEQANADLSKARESFDAKMAKAKEENKQLTSEKIEIQSRVAPLEAQRDAAQTEAAHCNAKYNKIVEGMKSVGKIAEGHENDDSIPPVPVKGGISTDEIVSSSNAIVDAHTQAQADSGPSR